MTTQTENRDTDRNRKFFDLNFNFEVADKTCDGNLIYFTLITIIALNKILNF